MDDYEDIPDDNRVAFLNFESEFRSLFDSELNEDGASYNYHAQSYMNLVVAAAREFEVGELTLFKVYGINSSSFSENFAQFKAAVDQVRIKYRIQINRTIKVVSVGLKSDQKLKIHIFLDKIRNEVELSAETQEKKDKIYKIIASLAAEVDMQRNRFERFGDLTRNLAGLSKYVAEEGAEP